MLAACENALVAQIKGHRLVTGPKRIRTVDSLPKLDTEALLKRYVADAPAIYVIPGRLRVEDSNAIMTFTIAGVVRNVAGNAQARKGDGIDIGCDHLLLTTVRAVHGHKVGPCTWNMVAAEMVDDTIFDTAGIAAVEMTFESTAIELDDDWHVDELDDFLTFHADVDVPPHESDDVHQQWLQANYAAQPDAQIQETLEGASS